MKISVTELLQEDEGNKSWHSVALDERTPDNVFETVYFPCLNQFSDYDTALKAFRRIRRAVDYARLKNPELEEFWDCQRINIGRPIAMKLHHEAESRNGFLIQQFDIEQHPTFIYFCTDRVHEV